MTPAQDQAIQQINALLGQHFDAWVCAVRATDENNYDAINSFQGGPLDSQLGLCRVLDVRSNRRIMDLSGPTEPFPK